MPLLLDTNVYLYAMRSDEGASFFERRFVPLVFQTHLSSIVVEQLYAGALDSPAIRLVERYVGALERAGRLINPAFEDWKEAGAADFFHGKHFGAILGALALFIGTGAGLGPWVGGYIYDLSGSYRVSFLIAIGLAVLSIVLIWLAGPRKHRQQGHG